MRKVLAFVPAHISGLFQPCKSSDLERAGSRNCGPCLTFGVRTEVGVERADRTSVSVLINGERSPGARTTLLVVKQLLRAVREPCKVEVNHSCQVPIGAGYGASGAGTLGAVLALSKALGLHRPREELTAMAHVAEVTCCTGLGDVGAQALGGLVMGVRPGAPSHGRWKRIPVPQNLKVVCATLGPLPTEKLLREKKFRRRSSELGGRAIEELMKQPTPERFMLASRQFADGLGLLDRELMELIEAAEAAGAVGASQVMLGRAVFALAHENNAAQIKDAFLDLLPPEQVMMSGIDFRGARFVSV